MDLDKALGIAASAMDAQTTRLRVIAENLADQDTTGSQPGADPYRRKTVTFENRLDRQLGAETVRVTQVEVMDMREAERSYSSNLAVMQASRSMLTRTIALLK